MYHVATIEQPAELRLREAHTHDRAARPRRSGAPIRFINHKEVDMRFSRSMLSFAAIVAIAAPAAAQVAASDSMLTRAQVRADTRAALAAGLIPRGEAQPSYPRARPSAVPRAEVRAETREALASGEIPHGDAMPDDNGEFRSTTTRAEVRTETLEAVRDDEIPYGRAQPTADAIVGTH
jgi:Domain of unknown function (DUF4148)